MSLKLRLEGLKIGKDKPSVPAQPLEKLNENSEFHASTKALAEGNDGASVVEEFRAPLDFSPKIEVEEGLALPPQRQLGFLSPSELRYKKEVLSKLLRKLDLSKIADIEIEDARRQIQEIALLVINEENIPLNIESRKKIVRLVEDEILGLGPLELLLKDPQISDIMVNGANCIYIERKGRLEKSPVIFDDDNHLMRIIERIVTRVGRRIDESVPMVDARLSDGSRVNAIIPPLALDGPVMSIRRFPADPLTLNGLVGFQTLTMLMATFISGAVKAGKNIVISGGTGSGKTTALNALSAYIPDSERIVTIEDAAELQLQQSHVVRLETRPPNVEGKGEVNARELVKNALRMRPDRIIVGEVRGEEAIDMLQAMNTGHDGSLTTVHANTPRDALSRIENMVAMAGYDLPVKAVRSQIASAIDLIIQVQRLEDGSRKIVDVAEVVGMEEEVVCMSDIYKYERIGIDQSGDVLGRFRSTGLVPTFIEDLKRKGIKVSLDCFDPDLDHGEVSL